ncbi:MAG: hypothetical protein OEV40_13690 [Acidimicrobiia bacterium]|nr:hypothetical protein [Acidimicrobiia bacterium]
MTGSTITARLARRPTTAVPTDIDVDVDIDDVIAAPTFSERHARRIDLPIERVWPAALAVKGSEIRTLGPLSSLRGLPAKLLGRHEEREGPEPTLLDGFAGGGFVVLRRDAEPVDGRALVVMGAVGRFWHPIGNQPLRLDSGADLLSFDEPGYACAVATIEAVDRGDHTELITETRVRGTDRSATLRFAPYWALIRYPSGLIRRSWLAAIERRARRPRAGDGSPRSRSG